MFLVQELSEQLLKNQFTNWYQLIPTAEITQASELAFKAAIIHDMSRTHDGVCLSHGQRAAMNKRWVLEEVYGKVSDADYAIIASAVSRHCTHDQPLNPTIADLTLALLKDADTLDRVRIGEKPYQKYLRLPFTHQFINTANKLYMETDDIDTDELSFEMIIDIGTKLTGDRLL